MPSRVHCRTLTWQLHLSDTSNRQNTPPLSPSTPRPYHTPTLPHHWFIFSPIHPTLIPYSQAQTLLFHFQITRSQPFWNRPSIIVRDAAVGVLHYNKSESESFGSHWPELIWWITCTNCHYGKCIKYNCKYKGTYKGKFTCKYKCKCKCKCKCKYPWG